MAPSPQEHRRLQALFPRIKLSAPPGFTLIELLVACAVLALVVALLTSTFSNFAGITSASGKRLETGNQARAVFDRMAFDFGSGIHSGGVEPSFRPNAQATGGTGTENDAFLLLADVRSTSAGSRLGRVGYEVDAETNSASGAVMISLYRCVEPFKWTDSIVTTNFTSPERQSIGRGVFRMELSFLRTNGTIAAAVPALDEISAVICTTASLDESTFAKLSESQRNRLIADLPDPPVVGTNSTLPLTKWNTDNFQDLPVGVRQNVRFNQRYFYLK